MEKEMFTLTNAYNEISQYNRSLYRNATRRKAMSLAPVAGGYAIKAAYISRLVYNFPLNDDETARFRAEMGIMGAYAARAYAATYTGAYRECDCGAWATESELRANGYCPGCGQAWETCQECGELIEPGTETYTADGFYVCGDCETRLYYAVDDDDYYWSADNLTQAYDSDDYYADADNLTWCEAAWEFYADRDNCDCYDCGESDCPYCPSIIRSWHDHKGADPIYWTAQGQTTQADFPGGVGVEIEIDYSADYCGDWSRVWHNETAQEVDAILGADRAYYEHDGSLNDGFEIITQPHDRAAWARFLPKLGEALAKCKARGYRAYDFGTCGLHIHMSRTLFGKTDWEQIDTINKVCALYEIHAQEIIALAKRDYEGGCSGGKRFHFDSVDAFEICQEARGRNYAKEARHDRYQAINLSNRATVEFRLAKGTLRLGRIADWVDFHFALISRARRTSWDSLPFVTFEELGNLD